MSRYDQALADWEYLWTTYGPAEDMTGAYVDQDDLKKLLRSPTKKTAAECLEAQIDYWFTAGPDTSVNGREPDPEDKRLQQIADRHGHGDQYPMDDPDHRMWATEDDDDVG